MRFSALLGGILATAMASVSYGTMHRHMPASTVSLRPLLGSYYEPSGQASRRPTRIERRTGAGSRNMHRAWKRRRASGRA